MAIEDSTVLAKLFGHLISVDQVPSFLYAFPELRQGRTKSTRVNEMGNIYFMTMPDDAGAIQRDAHFKDRRDKGLSPLEDESGGASTVWEAIKETWCYDAEDEADDWWVGWGMLRLRSQEMDLEFGMEIQVSASIQCSTDRQIYALLEYPTFFTSDGQIMISFQGVSSLNVWALLCFSMSTCYLRIYDTIASPSCGLEMVHYICLSCIHMYPRIAPTSTIDHAFACLAIRSSRITPD